MRKDARFSEEEQKQVAAEYLAGAKGTELARKYGVSTPVIYKLLWRQGIQPSKVAADRGTLGHGTRRFTDEEEKRIAADYAAGFSLMKLAKRYGAGEKTILQALRRNKAETRVNTARPIDPDKAKEIVDAYLSGSSIASIVPKYRISYGRIRMILDQAGIEYERATGPRHAGWKGGRRRTSDGYIDLWIKPDHPFFCMADVTGRVREHRLVMAEHLGRPLRDDEHVHHKNGQRDVNDIANLQLIQKRGHGAGHAFRCADCGSRNIVPEDLGQDATEAPQLFLPLPPARTGRSATGKQPKKQRKNAPQPMLKVIPTNALTAAYEAEAEAVDARYRRDDLLDKVVEYIRDVPTEAMDDPERRDEVRKDRLKQIEAIMDEVREELLTNKT